MEKELIFGVIKEFTLEIGKQIKWMEKGNFIGLMEENIKDNTEMIKKKDMEYLNGILINRINLNFQ